MLAFKQKEFKMFASITQAPADPILGLNEKYNNDKRQNKVNLGVGVYKNEAGITPILDVVKTAEEYLLNNETTKSYLSIDGMASYGVEVQKLLFGSQSVIIKDKRAQTAQAPGGTGAIRIAAEFLKQQVGANTVWISDPSWANHENVFTRVGFTVKKYSYYNKSTNGLDFNAMCSDLECAQPGDVVLLHGCCHNPTGIDLCQSQWDKLALLCQEKQVLPFFDFAYQGFGKSVDDDAYGLRSFAKIIPQFLVASSFSKNFGLYNERVGAFTLVAKNKEIATCAFSQVKAIIRALYSNPPAHGAAIVTYILTNPALKEQWLNELAKMRERIYEMRTLFVDALAAKGVGQDFSFIAEQNGMFSFSGLTPTQVATLQQDFAIYIVGSGRISVAGMTKHNLPILVDAISKIC